VKLQRNITIPISVRHRVPWYWWVMLGWFTLVALYVLAQLLLLASGVPPNNPPQVDSTSQATPSARLTELHGLYVDGWAGRAGALRYVGTLPSDWAPAVQDRVALDLFYSTNPDGAHWCDFTAYC
jgi:hypothetical protein